MLRLPVTYIVIKEMHVKLKSFITAAALMGAMIAPQAMAADAVDATQKKEIEKIIHDYIVSNPEVLVEASQALQQKQQQTMAQQAKAAIQENASKLFADSMTVTGNPKGNVTIVEFFDYQCGHCKKMAPVMGELIKGDDKLRVIYKEFPIFGKSSETASKAALAAAMQGKYKQMHEALMQQQGRLSDDDINKIAKNIGLNMDKFKKDMDSKEVKDALNANRELAEKLRLMGTPAFIIATTPAGQFKTGSEPTFIPGAASQQALQDLIKKAAGA